VSESIFHYDRVNTIAALRLKVLSFSPSRPDWKILDRSDGMRHIECYGLINSIFSVHTVSPLVHNHQRLHNRYVCALPQISLDEPCTVRAK
jgi:hypothetical protein